MIFAENNFKYVRDGDSWKKDIKSEGLGELKSFHTKIKFKRSREEFRCRRCEMVYSPKTRYFLGFYDKICFLCAERWIDGSLIKFDELKRIIKQQKKILLANKDKWNNELFGNAL